MKASQIDNHDLIPLLIQQDMKHHQLVEAICRTGFEGDAHHLRLMQIVARLMHIAENTIPDGWIEAYMDYLAKAAQYPVTSRGENLAGLAGECYMFLKSFEF